MTQHLLASGAGSIDRAADILRAGGLVAFPTETVYGLGADGLSETAVTRIFRAKARPADNPLILHVAAPEAALELWRAGSEELSLARQLMAAFWPGPLSLVLPKAAAVPAVVAGGLDTVAVRMPDLELARTLIGRAGRPLAAPSANRAGRPSPTTAAHVLRTLGGRIDAVLDGGSTQLGLESTVVDLCGGVPRVLREGSISGAVLAERTGIPLAPSTVQDQVRSPGTRYRHYAPADLATRLATPAELASAWHQPLAILCRAATAQPLGERVAALEALPDDPAGFARELYAALYRLEDSGCTALLIERLPEEPAWQAARDRTRRAAGAA